jgi:predicted PhzF superfamily epimerase YddE/YHI9
MDIFQVFHLAPFAQGNLAVIHGLADAKGTRPLQPLSGRQLPGAVTQCNVSRCENNQYRVDCYQRGEKIRCCGHGLLAVAHALFESGIDTRIDFEGGVYAERSPPEQGTRLTWLYLPAISAAPIDLPPWASQLFSTIDEQHTVPVDAAATGDTNGYLLLQLNEQICLESLNVDVNAISANTGQAVLAWQRSTEDTSMIKMRYFAPQYGNNEDAATGSVLRVLGPYLQRTAGLESFSVFQCSRQGGRMMVRNGATSVAINGNVQSVDGKELPAQ